MSNNVSETLREVTPGLADGRYSVIATLREGRLFLAEKAGKRCVLKTAEGAQGLEMLKREYELSVRLQHPFIASAIAWEEDSPVGPAIVIEYIQGRTLTDYIKENPSREARERVFGQLLDAVGAIHRQSVIHNDIKPENILITDTDNDVKLIDFGFADEDSRFNEKGLGGTRRYASPELLAHKPTDARSDIYSLGILLQDLLPGRYRHIARKCSAPSPDKRFSDIDCLKKAWGRRKRPLYVFCLLIAVLIISGLYFIIKNAPQPQPEEHLQITQKDSSQVETDVPDGNTKLVQRPASKEPVSEQLKVEATLRQAWEQAFLKVCKEMDEAGFREFLPIHVDYGTYDVDPLLAQLKASLSIEDYIQLSALNDALRKDYSARLYSLYAGLPSLYDNSLELPQDELKYYRGLVSNFKKFSPFPGAE